MHTPARCVGLGGRHPLQSTRLVCLASWWRQHALLHHLNFFQCWHRQTDGQICSWLSRSCRRRGFRQHPLSAPATTLKLLLSLDPLSTLPKHTHTHLSNPSQAFLDVYNVLREELLSDRLLQGQPQAARDWLKEVSTTQLVDVHTFM